MGNEKNVFSGCIPALMTPCDEDGTPDFDALADKGEELVSLGMNSVVYCGSMGDWPLLTDEQRKAGGHYYSSDCFTHGHGLSDGWMHYDLRVHINVPWRRL